MITSVHPPLDARIFDREARSVAAAGLRVTIIAPAAPRRSVEGVGFRSLPGGTGRWRRPLRWPAAMWQAIRSQADVYHLHDPELLPWGLLLHRLTGRPVLYDAHEFLAESITTKLWIPRLWRRPLARLAGRAEGAIARRLSAVVVVTEVMADRFRPVQPRTVIVHNFPVERGSASAAEPARSPQVIYAGLMNVERGLRILHGTAALVRAAHPEAMLVVLGPLEWQGLDAERRRSAAEWAAAGVRFVPPVPPADVGTFLAQASIGWLPMDGSVPGKRLAWPVKLGEYLAAGLPVVASDLPVQARVVREAGCGLVVDDYSAAAHAAAIIALLDDPARARRLGEAGRRYAHAHLGWATEAARLLDLYADLVADAGPASGTRTRSGQ